MSTFVGRIEAAPAAKHEQERETAEKTRAELVEEAEALGVTVPKNASKAKIQELIDKAEVI